VLWHMGDGRRFSHGWSFHPRLKGLLFVSGGVSTGDYLGWCFHPRLKGSFFFVSGGDITQD
jgi:hypothetical protein